MENTILVNWAKFHKINYLEKRNLLNQIVKDRAGINCEVRIYRILTRLTFQTLRKSYGESFCFTSDEKKLVEILNELDLSPSTANNWYYSSFNKHPLIPFLSECKSCFLMKGCDYAVPVEIMKQIKDKYGYKLVSKRIYQTIIKAEVFKQKLEEDISLSDNEIIKSLRWIVEKEYYRKGIVLSETDNLVLCSLKKQDIGAMAVLKWFYLLKNTPLMLKEAQDNKISPDDIIDKSIISLNKDLRGGLDADIDVCY